MVNQTFPRCVWVSVCVCIQSFLYVSLVISEQEEEEKGREGEEGQPPTGSCSYGERESATGSEVTLPSEACSFPCSVEVREVQVCGV